MLKTFILLSISAMLMMSTYSGMFMDGDYKEQFKFSNFWNNPQFYGMGNMGFSKNVCSKQIISDNFNAYTTCERTTNITSVVSAGLI